MPATPQQPDTQVAPNAKAAASAGRVSRFSGREWALLLVASAVAVVGATAAALGPDPSVAATGPATPAVATSTVSSCPTTATREAAYLAAVAASQTAAATTASTPATAQTTTTVSATAKRTTTTPTTRTASKPKKTTPAAKKPAPASLLAVGALINYGTYAGEPLQWRVLSSNSGELLLLSEYVLSAGAFQSDWEGKAASRYSSSEVRSWLTGDFASSSFTSTQSAALLPHAGGAAGSDRVFLLSAEEAKRYLPKAASRKAAPHAAAASSEVGFSGEPLATSGPYASWWLADAATDDFSAQVVKSNGKLGSQLVYYADLGVRPAIRVNRSKISFALDAQGGN